MGGLVGSLIAGPISDFLGRKPAILIGASLISLGGLFHTVAIHLGYVRGVSGHMFLCLLHSMNMYGATVVVFVYLI